MLMRQPPAPTGTDDTVGFRCRGLLGDSAAELGSQGAGESKPQLGVIEKNHRQAPLPQDQTPTVIQQVIGVDLRVWKWLPPWGVDRDRFLEGRLAKIGDHIGLEVGVPELLIELGCLANATEQ